jgi:hypothetical protein
MWYQAPGGQSEASPDERNVRTVFREFMRITGQLFIYPYFFTGWYNDTAIF